MKFRAADRICDFLFYMLAGALWAWSLSLAVVAATIIEVEATALLGMCTLFVAGFYLLFWSRRTVYIFLAVLGVTITAACIYLWANRFDVAWFLWMRDGVRWILALARESVPYQEDYAFTLAALISALLAALIALNTRVYFNLYMPAIIAMIILLGPVYMDWGRSESAAPLFLLSFLLLLCKKLNLHTLVGVRNRAGEKGGGTVSLYSFVLVPLCLVAFAAAWAMPKPDSETERERRSGNLFDVAEEIVKGFSSDKALTFADEGRPLGGPIEMTDQFVMEVTAQERVYLAGSVRDEYTGTSWRITDEMKFELEADDSGRYAPSEYTGEQINTQEYYMRYYGRDKKSLAVDLGNTRTQVVYTPPFRGELAFSDAVALSMNNYGQLRTARAMAADTTYTQSYISWDYSNQYFVNILQTMAAQTVDVAAEKAGLTQYLTLPDTLPQRVVELARTITDGAGNDYDRLMALERYLAAFPYTLEPDKVPSGEDFVDYFLFTGQEGYCVYFATALAVMGRAVDIPTRYVEGFVMPQERNGSGNYTVTNQQAHAWVEAYFPGFGWVRFEATPTYYAAEIGGPTPEPEEASLPERDVLEQPEETEPEAPPEEDEPAPATPTPGGQEDTGEPGGGRWIPVLLACLLTVGLSALFVWILVSRYRDRSARLEGLSNREKTAACFAGIVRVAETLGLSMEHNETAITYAARVGESPLFADQPISLPDLAEVFCRASYSVDEITDNERMRMEDCYRLLLKKLQDSPKHRLQYWFGRYILVRY